MQVANLRFLLRDDAIIRVLEGENLPYKKERFLLFAVLKNSKLELSKSQKGAVSNALYFVEYTFSLNGLDYTIKNYDFCDTCVLEVAFSEARQIVDFIMPSMLAQHCGDNITNDERYNEINLALFGAPCYKSAFGTVLARAKLCGDFALVTPGQISSFEGAKIALFGVLENTNIAVLDFLSKKSTKSLKKLIFALEKNYHLCLCCDSGFDEQIFSSFNAKFCEYLALANSLGGQNYLSEYMSAQNIESKSLKELKKERNIAEDELVLKLSEFSVALRDFSIMLSDDSDFYSAERGKKSLKASMALKLQNAIKDYENAPNTSAKSALKESSKHLYHALCAFGHLYSAKLSAKLEKKLLSILELYTHCDKCEFLANSFGLPQMKVINEKLLHSADESLEKIAKKHAKSIKTCQKLWQILNFYH